MLRRALTLESPPRQASSLMEDRFPEPSRMRALSASLTRNWRALARNPAVRLPDDPSQQWLHRSRDPQLFALTRQQEAELIASDEGTVRIWGTEGRHDSHLT